MTDRELMQQALEALELLAWYENPATKIQVRKPKDGGPIVTMYPHKVATEAAAPLRERLAQPEQDLVCVCGAIWEGQELVSTPLPRRVWQGLTDEEPVALPCCGYADASAVKWNPYSKAVQCHNCGQTYTPLAQPEQEPVPMRMPREGDRVICIEDDSVGTVQFTSAAGGPYVKFDDGSYGQWSLREFGVGFRYADPTPQPEQEPVIGKWSLREVYFDEDGEPISHRSPPQRKPLTDEEALELWNKHEKHWRFENNALAFTRAIEAAHGIKGEA